MLDIAPSKTAEAVCLFRALEQRRPRAQRVVDDPHAKRFLGRAATAALAAANAAGSLGELPARFGPGLAAYVLARHRLIDDALAAALDKTGADRIAQVVVLGAGYDTRAERFAAQLDGRPVYELDFPSTSRRKRELLVKHARELPATTRRQVEVDFLSQRFDARLVDEGFVHGAPTFFVWEGVSMYLTRATVKDTLTTLRRIGAPGSELTLDFWWLVDDADLRAAAHRFGANLLSLLGEPVLFTLHPEDAPPLLSRHGWGVVDLAMHDELQRRFVADGRPVYPGLYVAHARAA